MNRRPVPLAVAWGLGLCLAACSKRAPVPSVSSAATTATTASVPSARPPAPQVPRLATPSAFELTASPGGATLVWATSGRAGGALYQLELDAAGAWRGKTERSLSPSAATTEVTDLSAAWVDGRLALAWLAREGAKATVRAAWAGSAAPPFDLGAAWSAPRTSRGNVVIAARGKVALVFARGAEVPCIEPGRHGCFAFGFHELETARAVPTGLPMSVPVPCSDNSAELAVVGSRFHYGVCTDSGKGPVTTMFSIQRDPEYARADTLLEGCTPAGTFVWRGAAWLVADCEGGRRAARVGDDPPEFLDLRSARLECRSGHLRIRTQSLDLSLDEPRSGLALLLPPDVATSGARAAWTGRALVVATSFAEQLRVDRRECRGDRLETTTLLP